MAARTTSAYYSIDDERLAAIIDSVVSEELRAATTPEIYDEIGQAVQDFLLADWAEGAEHQDWLDAAPLPEIVSWVRSGLDGRVQDILDPAAAEENARLGRRD